jgi:hypothetical protein
MALTYGQSQSDVFLDRAPWEQTGLLKNRSDPEFVGGWVDSAFEVPIQTHHDAQDRRLSNSGRTDQA